MRSSRETVDSSERGKGREGNFGSILHLAGRKKNTRRGGVCGGFFVCLFLYDTLVRFFSVSLGGNGKKILGEIISLNGCGHPPPFCMYIFAKKSTILQDANAKSGKKTYVEEKTALNNFL